MFGMLGIFSEFEREMIVARGSHCRRPHARGDVLCTETGRSHPCPERHAGSAHEGNSRTMSMNADEKSDEGMVPMFALGGGRGVVADAHVRFWHTLPIRRTAAIMSGYTGTCTVATRHPACVLVTPELSCCSKVTGVIEVPMTA
jgi:hypothetical protein